MSDATPQSVLSDCRKYVKSRIVLNTFNTFNNVRKTKYGCIKCSSFEWKHYEEKIHKIHGDKYEIREEWFENKGEKMKIGCKTHGVVEVSFDYT